MCINFRFWSSIYLCLEKYAYNHASERNLSITYGQVWITIVPWGFSLLRFQNVLIFEFLILTKVVIKQAFKKMRIQIITILPYQITVIIRYLLACHYNYKGVRFFDI